jgi:hypothetical protein
MTSSSASEPETKIKGIIDHLVRTISAAAKPSDAGGSKSEMMIYAAQFERPNKIVACLYTGDVQKRCLRFNGDPLPHGALWAITVHDVGGLPIFVGDRWRNCPGRRNDFGCWNFLYPKFALNLTATLPMQAW